MGCDCLDVRRREFGGEYFVQHDEQVVGFALVFPDHVQDVIWTVGPVNKVVSVHYCQAGVVFTQPVL